MSKRTLYTREFKLEAVRLLQTGQKPTSELAMQLGVKRSVLYRWRDEYERDGEYAFRGSGKSKPSTAQRDQQLKTLQHELAELKEENAILKKAAAFFARELK